MSYSVDMLLRSAFTHELLNKLQFGSTDEEKVAKVYLQKRIKEISDRHKEQNAG